MYCPAERWGFFYCTCKADFLQFAVKLRRQVLEKAMGRKDFAPIFAEVGVPSYKEGVGRKNTGLIMPKN